MDLEIPEVKITDVKRGGGDIFIGHHLLIAPALLLEKKLRLDESNFLDFCTMINMTSLHNRLITLPTQGLPHSLTESSLYKYLISEGILHQLESEYYKSFDDEDKKEVKDFLPSNFDDEYVEDVMSGAVFYQEFYESHGTEWTLVNPEIKENTKSLKSSSEYPVYQDEEGAFDIHRLRTAAYWIIAGKLGIPFMADFVRIPVLSKYFAKHSDHLDVSVRVLLQKASDIVARKELEATAVMKSAMLIPIPNAAANFLNTYSSNESIKNTLNDIRKEYTEHSKQITEWEKRQFDPDITQFDKVKLNNEIISTLKEASSKKDMTQALAQVATGFIQDISSQTPGVGSAVPVGILIWDQIKKYRAKKRISYFLSGKEEASIIKNHPKVLERAFGNSLNKEQVKRFSQLAEQLDSLSKVPKSHTKP